VNGYELAEFVARGEPQPAESLRSFIAKVGAGDVDRDEATSWLKAVHEYGCPTQDTVVLTRAMINSGAQLEWGDGPPVVDKHSTGGVGDKMSLMLAPALAACGCRVPMLAGRGLGHTGGTIDKLESIPGFNCSLTPEEMVKAVNQVGACIAVQNDAIAPADGVLYALRDITHTIDSVPLITASIVSKKAAEGLDALVLDVKTGKAAFMQSFEEAETLAQSMVETATGLGIQTVAQITAMTEPIGTHIGNALEVIESIEVLHGEGSQDTRDLVVLQGGALLAMTDHEMSEEEGRRQMELVLDNGQALEAFKSMCLQQGVEAETLQRLIKSPSTVLGTAPHQTTILARKSGIVQGLDAMALATLAREHGAGRFELDDVLDPLVGYILHVAIGDAVDANQPLLTFYHTKTIDEEETKRLNSSVIIGSEPVERTPRLLRVVESSSTKP
jgi:thymidine phosphorylase